MKDFLLNLIKRFGNKKTALRSLGLVFLSQIVFILGNNFWRDFSAVTSVMPDLKPNYTQEQFSEVVRQYGQLKPAVLGVYTADALLPLSALLLTVSLLALLIKNLFKSYRFLTHFILLFPIINFLSDYLENFIMLGYTFIQPSSPSNDLFYIVSSTKFMFGLLTLILILLLSLVALTKKFFLKGSIAK